MRSGDRWLGRVSALVVDAVIAVGLTAVALVVGIDYFPRSWGGDPLPFVFTVLIFAPMALRRVAPVAVLVTGTLALAAYLALGYDQLAFNFWGPVLALYTVASLRPPRVTAACVVLLVPVMFWATAVIGMTPVVAVAEVIGVPVMAWAFGNVGRTLAIRNEQLARLTGQLRAEQQQRLERAVTEERVRIARELHDVVAHHISVISVQTGLAGYVVESDPATAREALTTIGSTSREALQEMRRMLMLLRTDVEGDEAGGGGRSPAPDLARLPELVDRVRAAGLPVTLTTTGEVDTTLLPSGLQLCAYRVVQEALTNVLKHAASSSACVAVRADAGQLVVRVVNGPGRQAAMSAQGTKHGLINMRERAAVYGGTLAAGPRADGGFEVELVLPLSWGDQPGRVPDVPIAMAGPAGAGPHRPGQPEHALGGAGQVGGGGGVAGAEALGADRDPPVVHPDRGLGGVADG